MKILVVSDSHGRLSSLKKYMDRATDIDMIIHLGDYCRDADILKGMYNKNVIAVKGNCDLSNDYPTGKQLIINNKKLFITHGHSYRVKWGKQWIIAKGVAEKTDVVLFGHTHIPEIFYSDGIVFLNPGSVGEPRLGKDPTLGSIHISGNSIFPKIIKIKQ